MVYDAKKSVQYRCSNKDCPRHKAPFSVKFLRCQKCGADLEPIDPEKPPSSSGSGSGSSGTVSTASGGYMGPYPPGPGNPSYGNPVTAVPTDWAAGETDPNWAAHPCEVVSVDLSDLSAKEARALLDVLTKNMALLRAPSRCGTGTPGICPLHGAAGCACAQRKRLGYDLVWLD